MILKCEELEASDSMLNVEGNEESSVMSKTLEIPLNLSKLAFPRACSESIDKIPLSITTSPKNELFPPRDKVLLLLLTKVELDEPPVIEPSNI